MQTITALHNTNITQAGKKEENVTVISSIWNNYKYRISQLPKNVYG